ncbi:MAG: M48 family metallopeptidase [Burkholderiales bacterium]|nr:M48 family metallopeptidase [Burkholderiales bacterium]
MASRCDCPLHARRRFSFGLGTGAAALAGASLAWPAWAREGVDVGKKSIFAGAVPADQIEKAASQQYLQMRQEAQAKQALASAGHPQMIRLRAIAERLVPHTYEWNERARQWRWEVNLLMDKQINAFCMPGGKIAFYYGILAQLQLTDDEVAMIMGHEMAHALREHARERMGKQAATRGLVEIGAALFGLGQLGRTVADMGAGLLTLKFGREDESEADLVGMELAARGGYDPHAGVSLWQKMLGANKNAPPQFMSTHPSSSTRISDIERNLPKVTGLFARADKPAQRFAAPSQTSGARG